MAGSVRRNSKQWFLIGLAILIAGIVGAGFTLFRPASPPPLPGGGQTATAELRADDMILGDADAPVTIIEYASLSCPHCAEFHVEILPNLKAEYIDQGKARLVFRDFPLNKPALEGAVLARCLGPLRFFGMADALFRQQRAWVTEDSLNQLAGIARMAGVDQAAFDACQADQGLKETIVQRMQEDQQKYEIEGTPTFIINGRKQQAVETYEEFKKIIDAHLEMASSNG